MTDPELHKSLLSKKIYTVVVEEYINENGEKLTQIRRTSDGFEPLEILGLIAFIHDEVVGQIKGTIKPEIVKRTAII